MASAAANAPPPGTRPFWIPEDLRFDTLAPALQTAVREIIDPAYKELVLQASSALERAMGVTFAKLLWLEMIETIDLAKDMGRTLPLEQGTDEHQPKIGRYLRLVGQKDKVAKFLLAVQKYSQRPEALDPLRRPIPLWERVVEKEGVVDQNAC